MLSAWCIALHLFMLMQMTALPEYAARKKQISSLKILEITAKLQQLSFFKILNMVLHKSKKIKAKTTAVCIK